MSQMEKGPRETFLGSGALGLGFGVLGVVGLGFKV